MLANASLNNEKNSRIPENKSMLKIITTDVPNFGISSIVEGLKEDKVILLKGITSKKADEIITEVADKFGLAQALEIQAGFASLHGHRENVGEKFMTVNKRDDFQIIPPHSEGTRFSNMQLASFYCYQNTTDGGETILLNTDDEAVSWSSLKELGWKVDIGNKVLTPTEIFAAKSMLQIEVPRDLLKKTDVIVSEESIPVPGVKLYSALSCVEKTLSVILNRDVNVYWDNVASVDFSSADEFFKLLKCTGLLKPAPSGIEMDNCSGRRVRTSGILYSDLFKNKITHKLQEGELVIQNNLTWTHSTNSWTPGSGVRKVVAAFA
jgi:hypothetical protein